MASGIDLDPSALPDELLDTLAGRTDRTHANRYYADLAREVVEHLAEQVSKQRGDASGPIDPIRVARLRLGMDWILARKTVLTELGRSMTDDPSEQDIERFQDMVYSIAERYDRLTAKTAIAKIRRRRLGETGRRDRISALHHDLNAAINLHRQRFPESGWEDVQRALELTTKVVGRKLA